MDYSKLLQKVEALEREVNTLKGKLSTHQHVMNDGTSPLRKNITLDIDQAMTIGQLQEQSFVATNATDGKNYIATFTIGESTQIGKQVKTPNLQMTLTHIPNSAGKFSYITAVRNPAYTSYENKTISTTSGGSTVTIADYNFTTNELAGCYINIYDSSANLVETQLIASNTSTVITISGTWISSTTGTFFIYTPVFLGRNEQVFRRAYVEGGSATGGVRFGIGQSQTANHKNGLLYMDSAGDLYWKYAANAATKLN